jgi:hypothetical protein
MNEIYLLELIDYLRSHALPIDWEVQRIEGHRRRVWSRTEFDELLFEKRPEIGTRSFLKTAYIYRRHNEALGSRWVIDPAKVQPFLEFLFCDLATAYGWPEVIIAFEEFEGGMFYSLLDEHNILDW